MPPRPKVFPVPGGKYSNDWGGTRSRAATGGTGRHQGIDIFAPHGTPVYAIEGGIVTKMGPSKIGGNRVWINGRFYYAHLSGFADGLKKGDRVKAGQVIGYVGTTGDAKGTPPHLHLGFSRDGSQGGRYDNPYDTLRALESGGALPESGAPPRGAAPAGAGTPPSRPNFDAPPLTFDSPPVPGGPVMAEPEITLPGATTPFIDPQELAETWRLLAGDPFSSEETRSLARTAGWALDG